MCTQSSASYNDAQFLAVVNYGPFNFVFALDAASSKGATRGEGRKKETVKRETMEIKGCRRENMEAGRKSVW